MDYKGIEYQVVQTASLTGWKWTVFLDANRTRTGHSYSKAAAIRDAEHAIDKVAKGSTKPK